MSIRAKVSRGRRSRCWSTSVIFSLPIAVISQLQHVMGKTIFKMFGKFNQLRVNLSNEEVVATGKFVIR